jgi:hypothetical protein
LLRLEEIAKEYNSVKNDDVKVTMHYVLGKNSEGVHYRCTNWVAQHPLFEMTSEYGGWQTFYFGTMIEKFANAELGRGYPSEVRMVASGSDVFIEFDTEDIVPAIKREATSFAAKVAPFLFRKSDVQNKEKGKVLTTHRYPLDQLSEYRHWEDKTLHKLEEEIANIRGRAHYAHYDSLRKPFAELAHAMDWQVRELRNDLAAYAVVAENCKDIQATGHFCFPRLNEAGHTAIKDAVPPTLIKPLTYENHHPVPNDYVLNGKRLQIITGPVTGGKTTYAKTLAMMQVMAQSGLPIPAADADICVRDRIFVHEVGPGDDYSSRFQYEMRRLAEIFRSATPKSLVVLDEPCGATDHAEGVEAAKTVLRGLYKLGPQTLYVTHMHELSDLAESLPAAQNLHEQLDEKGVTHKIQLGKGASHSSIVLNSCGLKEEQLLKMLANRAGKEGFVLDHLPDECS